MTPSLESRVASLEMKATRLEEKVVKMAAYVNHLGILHDPDRRDEKVVKTLFEAMREIERYDDI